MSEIVTTLRPYRSGPHAFRTRLLEPRIAGIAGLDVYVGVLPKAEVPADFFEVVPVEQRLFVAIGDGPSVSLKSAFVARFLATLFRELACTAAGRIWRVGERLYDRLKSGRGTQACPLNEEGSRTATVIETSYGL